MSDRQFFIDRRKAELPVFLRVLKALPPDQMSYKPHERSPSAAQLMWTLTGELRSCVELLRDGKTEWKAVTPPSHAEMLALFEQFSLDLIEAATRSNDPAWRRKGQLIYGGKVVLEQPVGEFCWFILFDAIHHRGQLSAYIRPMGGKVPAIYGPSADERPVSA